MAYKLYLSDAPLKFGGYATSPINANYIVVGAPLDATTSYMPGTRFAPYHIRIASQAIEFNTINGIDMDDYPGSDLGDIVVVNSVADYIDRVAIAIKGIINDYKKPILVLGGEHTITLGVVKGVPAGNTCVMSFDAHFDYRDNYMSSRINHATVMRRIGEIIHPENVLIVGARAFSPKEELADIQRHGVGYILATDIERFGVRTAFRKIRKWIDSKNCDSIHLTVDMDVFDPSYAPGVGNPEPFGITPRQFIELLANAIPYILETGTVIPTVDIVEVNPLGDCNNVTSILAAKIGIEIIAAIVNRREADT